ncbi:MAG: molybdopterin cofactor-binding domain-containing protein [Terracidiphilus sp.]|jgi:isoquinoline 1-oxidoreductase
MNHRDEPELENFQDEYWGASGNLPLDRRDFLKVLGGGVLVCLAQVPAWAQESGRAFGGHELPKDVSAWLHIAADGKVKVFTGKAEVGQNIRTSLAQLVAEELRTPFDSIVMVMGDTGLTPWDMGTFGSRTTPTMGPQLRNMAATARKMLLEMAAERWHVSTDALTAAEGKIVDSQNSRMLTYGELTRGENLVKIVSGEETLTPVSEWKIAGSAVPKVEGRDLVTGKHVYPSDITRPGMLYGAVLRADGFNATMESIDTSAAVKLPGVQVVRDGDFTGVVATDAYSAQKAISAIQAKWNVPAQPSNKNLFDVLKASADSGGEEGSKHTAGSVEQAMATASVKLEERYTVQYIAHAPLEPRAAVAEWSGDNLTVWTGTQRPFGVRDQLTQLFRIPAAQVRVIQSDMGSGYGGKHTGEAALEAARLAKAAGKPVKVVWTRQEEFTWAYLRPAGVMEIKAGAQQDGTLVVWEHHNYNSGSAAIATPYNIPNQLIQYHPSRSPLRQGSYRSLAAAANVFARESHMDGMAHAAGIDPLEFRLKNLTDPRLRAVFETAAEKFGWGRAKSAPESGFGIAGGFDKGGYVAACVEVEIDSASKKVRIVRVVQAWESGAVVNPDGLHNQISGAIVQAIGGALFEEILFADGRILNPHFSKYRLPRFSDVPRIEVVIINRKDLPSAGAGETGIVALAPAVGNAIFAATGNRLPNMPMTL